MDRSDAPLRCMIDRVAGALAQCTVDLHTERDPGLGDRYGRDWRGRWTADVRTRVRHLAQAAALGRPALFTEQLIWSMSSAQSRGVDTEDLKTSLGCLREVVSEQLPPAASRECLSCIDAAIAAVQTSPPEPRSAIDPASPHYELTLRFLELSLSGRASEAERVVVEAAESGASVPDLYMGVLRPALAEVGRMWHIGESTVADEHLVTATAERVMGRLHPYFPVVPPRGRTVLATSVSGDLHSVGVRMVADFFEMDGWNALFLGANTPAADIIEVAAGNGVDLLAVSASGLLHLGELCDLLAAVRIDDRVGRTPIIVGGAPFATAPDLWRQIGADGSAINAGEAVRLGNRLAGS